MTNSLYNVTIGQLPQTSDVNQLVDIFTGLNDVGQINYAPTLFSPTAINFGVVAQQGTGMAVGTFNYVFTFITGYYKSDGTLMQTGETTASSALTVVTSSGNTSVKISLQTVGLPSSTVAIGIYRTAVGGSTYSLVSIVKAGNAIYIDTLADASLGVAPPTANTTGTSLQLGGVHSHAENDGELVVTNKNNKDAFRVFHEGGQTNNFSMQYMQANNDCNQTAWMWYSDSSTWGDWTLQANYAVNYELNPPSQVGFYLYLGNTQKINYQNISMATFGTGGGVLTFQYWNGTAWVTLPNIVDGTANFTKNGKLTFDIPNDWALHTPSQDTAWGRSTTAALPPNNGLNSNGTAQYWIRIGCSTAFTNTPYIQYITPSPFPGYLAFYSNGGFNRFYVDAFGNGYFAGNLIVDGQLQWNNVSYVNTYSDWGNGFAPTSYVRNGSMVRLRGIVKTNSFGVGNAMFGLPSGYRPANSKFFICLGYSSVYGYGLVGVQVDPNGNVTQQSALWNGNTTASAQWCSLEQISFPVNS